MVILFDMYNLPDDIFEVVFATEQQVVVGRMLIDEIKSQGGEMGKTEMSVFANRLHEGTTIEVIEQRGPARVRGPAGGRDRGPARPRRAGNAPDRDQPGPALRPGRRPGRGGDRRPAGDPGRTRAGAPAAAGAVRLGRPQLGGADRKPDRAPQAAPE